MRCRIEARAASLRREAEAIAEAELRASWSDR
jgi:hypothetical protein